MGRRDPSFSLTPTGAGRRKSARGDRLWVDQSAQVILVIISPEAKSSRHIREAMDMASKYQRPVCGIWIEGEHLEHCLPKCHVDFAALIDAREKDTPAVLKETAKALEQVRLASENGTEMVQPSIPDSPTESAPPTHQSTEMHSSEQSTEFVLPQSRMVEVPSSPPRSLEPTHTTKPMPTTLPQPAIWPIPDNRKGLSRSRAALFIGLAILVIAGGLLDSLSLLTHFGLPSIKLDIQNYGVATFFGSFLPEGKPSPSTGAVAGRNDIAEFAANTNTYDPDDSLLVPCNQYPHYCNPALNALYKQELETADAGQRQQIFSQIHQIYLTDFPFIPLYFPLDVAVVRKGVHNYQISPFDGEINIWQ